MCSTTVRLGRSTTALSHAFRWIVASPDTKKGTARAAIAPRSSSSDPLHPDGSWPLACASSRSRISSVAEFPACIVCEAALLENN